MKTLLKKGTHQIDQKRKEKCLKDWGVIAYGNSSHKSSVQNGVINMNDIFHGKTLKTIQ